MTRLSFTAFFHGLLVCSTVAPGLSAQTIAVEFAGDADASAEDRDVIRTIAEATYQEVREILPELTGTVRLSVSAGPEVIPETGDGAAALEPGHVLWVADPSRAGGIAGVARERLRVSLYHELHHLARGYVMSGGSSPISLLDSVVSEGLATAFARDAAGEEPLWGAYPDNVDDWVEELRAAPAHDTESYGTWMYEHPDGRRWIGYRAGTYIADRAIAASGLSAAELVSTPTEEILRLAGFG